MSEIARRHNIASWTVRWAAERGAELAVVDATRRLDWRSFDARTSQAAAWLRAEGLGTGDRVALLLANRSAYLELVFAAARIGAISVPINARLSAREIAYVLGDCRPRALFHEASLVDVVAAARESTADRARAAPASASASDLGPALVVSVGDAPSDPYEAALARYRADDEIRPVSPDEPMMIMYTSGTTGEAKGALLPHRKTLFNARNAELFFELTPRDRVLVAAPLFHSLGLKILSLPTLYAGGAVVLHERFDADAVWADVAREGVSFLGGVPTMYRQLFDRVEAGAVPDAALRQLRFGFTAGAAIGVDLLRAFAERGLLLKQGYGQTETSILCCLDTADALRKAGSVGRAVHHAELRLIAPATIEGPTNAWRDIEPGSSEHGEIVARGPITMLGYWGREAASTETLREGGWLRTGDLATRDAEGFFTLVGRARDMYISGGENVYPAEVEAVFAEHPAVREIAVVGIPDARWGEIGRAHIVPAQQAEVDEEALLAWARPRLASFKLPKEFRSERELPKTASGKVQKHRLRGAAEER